MSIRRPGGVGLAVLGVAAAFAAFAITRPDTRPGRVDSLATEGAEPTSARAGGVEGRRVDPASPVSRWISPETDAATATTLALKSDWFRELPDPAWVELLQRGGWIYGFADGTPFGEKMLSCQVEHESTVSEQCTWRNTLVVERAEETTGRVSYVELTPGRGWEQPGCVAWARCVQSAWQGREAPFPAGYSDEMLAFQAPGNRFFSGGAAGADFVDEYRSHLVQLDEIIDNFQARLDAGDSSSRVVEKLYTMQAQRNHVRRLLERVGGGNE